MSKIIEMSDVKKYYDSGKIKALDGATLALDNGEFVSIMGPSGSGKSSLLNMIGGLDSPDSGKINVNGIDITNKRDLANFRAKTIGFIFQLHNLIPSQTSLENVMLPMYEGNLRSGQRRRRALELLEEVGLGERVNSYPTQLSGGERQRVAIARALANSPDIILADEPTGSLDSKSSGMILDLLTEIWEKEKKTLIIITHEEEIGRRAQRIIHMLDGRVANKGDDAQL